MEAAGLASSIITFIDFSYKIVTGTVDVYKKSTTGIAADTHISIVIKDLQNVTSEMAKSAPVGATSTAVTGQTPAAGQARTHQQALAELAANCTKLSDDLLAILKSLERNPDGNKMLRSIQAAWRTHRKSDQITEIDKKLGDYSVQIILRLSQMMVDNGAAVELQLGRMRQGNEQHYSDTISVLSSVQEAIKKLDTHLRDQAIQIFQASVIHSDQAYDLKDIRDELSRIVKLLATVHEQTPADLQILAKLRFDHVHAREDAIAHGEFGVVMSLLGEDPYSSEEEYIPSEEEEARAHAHGVLSHWMEVGDKVLHISGKAGSGKSTLMKLLSKNKDVEKKLRAWAGTKTLVTANFYFWLSGNNHLQNSLEGLYRSILLEVLQQCPGLTRAVFPKEWNEGSTQSRLSAQIHTTFRLPELQDAMEKLVRGFPGSSNYRFCFSIDGLDEYAGTKKDHLHLAKQIQAWAQSPDIRICASSRPHQEFHLIFDTRIDLHELNGPDIRRFSEHRLEDENKGHLSEDEVDSLSFKIENHAHGVFLWAQLVIESVCEGIRHFDYHFTSLKSKIEQAPQELTDLFLYLFNHINPADRTRAYQLLLWAASGFADNANALVVSWILNGDLKTPTSHTRHHVLLTEIETSQSASPVLRHSSN